MWHLIAPIREFGFVGNEHLELPFTNKVPSFKPYYKTEIGHYDLPFTEIRNLRLREVITNERSHYQEVEI